ncbi:hypothetical protein JNUCC64_06400 [Streptomyces sp. JNUCC 64]
MQARLGPLEWVAHGGNAAVAPNATANAANAARWVVGDSVRGGAFLELRADGIAPWGGGAPKPVVPWARFTDLDTLVAAGPPADPRAGAPGVPGAPGTYGAPGTPGQGVPGGAPGQGGSCLRATLGHPDELWVGRFAHHQDRAYTVSEVLLVGELLRQTVEAGHAAWLGDAGWLGHTVGRLAPLAPRTNRAARLAVAGVLAG